MAAYDRDAFVEKLRCRERGEEDVFFGRRDRELIDRIRERTRALEEDTVRTRARMRCPECGTRLEEVVRRGIRTAECPAAHGLWVTRDALRDLPVRERDSWLARYLPYLPR
jgi:uncharacterized protein with PIN domain